MEKNQPDFVRLQTALGEAAQAIQCTLNPAIDPSLAVAQANAWKKIEKLRLDMLKLEKRFSKLAPQ